MQPEPFEGSEKLHDQNLVRFPANASFGAEVRGRHGRPGGDPQKRRTTAAVIASQSAPAKGKAPESTALNAFADSGSTSPPRRHPRGLSL